MQRATDDYWFVSTVYEQLHRLPSELEHIWMRDVCELRAYAIVKMAYSKVLDKHHKLSDPKRR